MNRYKIDNICNHLKKEEVICMPTDTVWALIALATSEKATSNIYKLKHRHNNKPLALLVNNIAMAKNIIELNQKAEKMLCYENMPITIIAKQKLNKNIARAVNLKTQNIALRIPKALELINIITKLNTPLAATSANISGQEFCKINAQKIFYNKVSFFAHEQQITEPSVILDFTSMKAKIIRANNSQKEILKDVFKLS